MNYLNKMKNYVDIKNFEDLIEFEYGKIGSESRMQYEKNVHFFIESEMLKETKLSQQELDEKSSSK